MTACAFLMAMRTGKTPTTIAVLGRLYLDGRIHRALVVAPKSVLGEWKRQVEAHADYPMHVTVPPSESKKRIATLEHVLNHECEGLHVVVLNYEAIGRSRQVESLLGRWAPSIVVADEMHKLKHSGSQQSKAIRRIASKARYRLGLTGTPFSQSPQDSFGQYLYLDPTILGTSASNFRARYMREVPLSKTNPDGPKFVVGPKPEMLPELTSKVHSIAFEVALSDCYDMVDPIEVERSFDLPEKARRLYDRLAKESIAELEAGGVVVSQNVLTKALRLQQLAGGFVHDEDGAVRQVHDAKVDLLGEVLDELLPVDGERVVVFARYTAEVGAICELLKSRSLGYELVTGATSATARTTAIENFLHPDGPRVFVGQVQAAGTGIPLHTADTTIFYSLPTSVSDWLQARARTEQVGKDRPVTYVNLVARDTVDERLARALEDKQGLAELVTRGWRGLFGG